MELIVTVSENLSLYAGTVTTHADILVIHPPEHSLYHQLCTWLDQCPPPTVGFNHWVLAIGTTALCLRWGTYLAVLMDEAKPVDPRARHLRVSMVSEEEMRRINIEASSNLACLLQLWHQDEYTFFDRLRRAYEQLPMPQRRVRRNREPLEMILGFLIGIHKTGETSLPANAPTAVSHPYRAVANAIVNLTYRNGPVEDVHAGRGAAYSLSHRRFTDRQAGQIIRYTAERLSPFVSDFPLWGGYLADMSRWPERIEALPASSWYPRGWSLTESSSQIRLKQEWTV